MSGLHEAVARAIASARQERQYHPPVPNAVHDGERWHDVRYQRVESQAETDARMAAAAIGVCLAEAQRQVRGLEALHGYAVAPDTPLWVQASVVLHVLAALAGEDEKPSIWDTWRDPGVRGG